MKDYYLVFALTRSATQAEVKARYRQLVKQYHPDKPTGNAEAFKLVQEAYAVLGDPAARREYDMRWKVREFVPKTDADGAVDLIAMLQGMAAGRLPEKFVAGVSPAVERLMEAHGLKPRAATAENIMEALGWLKPKRKVKRA